jgi:WD40 repeat protein
VSASYDRTVRIWDADSGAQVALLPGHESFVYSAQYSRDGKRIVSASEDKTVRIWDVRPRLSDRALVAAAEAALPRQLTAYQRQEEFLTADQP